MGSVQALPCTIVDPEVRTAHACIYSSYKRVKGRSKTAEKGISMHPHKPHATSQCIYIPVGMKPRREARAVIAVVPISYESSYVNVNVNNLLAISSYAIPCPETTTPRQAKLGLYVGAVGPVLMGMNDWL